MIINGDALTVLKRMDSESVHMAVTSPPYYSPKKGLRDYKVPEMTWPDGWVGDLGKEPTPSMYARHLTEIFHELRRVLRHDSTFWLNLGDSHAGSGCGPSGKTGCVQNQTERQNHSGGSVPTPEGYKKKELFGIPFLVGEHLRADGWYWRSIIPWFKKNGMPGSYTDRPVSTIEYILILTKTPNNYYDHVAVLQDSSESYKKDKRPSGVLRQRVNENTKYDREESQFKKQDNTGNSTYTGFNNRYKESGGSSKRFLRESDFFFNSFRGLWLDEDNEPTALMMNPKPLKMKHFAAFPPDLPGICLLASTSERGVCPHCGSPWIRNIRKTSTTAHDGKTECDYEVGSAANRLALLRQAARERGEEYESKYETIGWSPTCNCPNNVPVPATVLDPFNGAGSTGVACKQHGRNYIGIDLNPDYCKMSEQRVREGK